VETVPTSGTYDTRLVAEAITAIRAFAGEDVCPATAAGLLARWVRRPHLSERQVVAIVAAFEGEDLA